MAINKLIIENSSGRVGIGITNPDGKLDVSVASNQRIRLDDFGGTSRISSRNDSATILPLLIDGSTLALNSGSGGNVAIGTTSPSQKFHVEGGSALIKNGESNVALWLGNSAYGFELEYSTGKIFTTINSNKRVTVDNSGNVGIGTTNPAEKLQINGSMRIGNLKIENANGGRIGFNRNTSNGAIYDSNYAAFQINGAYSGANYLDFQNYDSSGGYLGSFIFSGGNIGIGTTSPAARLDSRVTRTSGTNVTAFALSDNVTGAQTPGFGTQIRGLSNGGNAISAIGFESGDTGTNNDTQLSFYTQSTAGGLTRQVIIRQFGGVQCVNTVGVGNTTPSTSGAGITFPATQSASSDANTLDDYEEGDWTPVWQSTGTLPTLSYSTQSGRYVKIGRVVYFWARIYMNSWGGGGGSGNIQMGGLPFTSVNDSDHGGPLCHVTFTYSGGNATWPTGATQVFGRVLYNSTTIEYISLGVPTTGLGENGPLQWSSDPQMYNNYVTGMYFV